MDIQLKRLETFLSEARYLQSIFMMGKRTVKTGISKKGRRTTYNPVLSNGENK